jgi:hypothetical protein
MFATYTAGADGQTRVGEDGPTLFSQTIFTEQPDRWVHLAAVYDGHTKTLYVEGVRVASKPHTGPFKDDDARVSIGSKDFTGLIDEVRIWNRARSQDEITRDMRRKIRGDTPGLIAAYSFDEGEGGTVKDRTPHRNDGWFGSAPGEDSADPMWFADTPF